MALTAKVQISAEDKAKAVVLNHLLASRRVTRGAVIATEFVMGKSGTRADLAVFGQAMIGIEIKTAKDTLRRLPSQLPAYQSFCHQTILAVAPKHLSGLEMIGASEVDIWLLLDDGSVREFRSASTLRGEVDVRPLLTLEETKKLDRSLISNGTDRVEKLALELLAKRYAQTSQAFWHSIGRRRVKPSDLEMLSRFRQQRLAVAEWEATQRETWREWQEDASLFFARA